MQKTFPLLIAFAISLTASAQSGIKADTLWIHRSAPDAEDIDTFFPIIKYESKPGVARNINTALQMQALGYILNEKNKLNLMKMTDNPLDRINLTFALKRLSGHVLAVDIGRFNVNNSMSLNGWYSMSRYLFDTDSGQPLTVADIFSQPARDDQSRLVAEGLRKSMLRVMGRYQDGFKDEDIAKLDEDCQCECAKYLRTAFCDGKVRLDFDPATQSFSFVANDCDWMNPRPHDEYVATMDKSITDEWLTPYGKYLFYNGPLAPMEGVNKLWRGSIDGKIPVTLLFKRVGCQPGMGAGMEIYDRFGVSIPLLWTVTLPDVKLEELGGDGKPVATITAVLINGKLVGKWSKSDGSKTLAFEAELPR